MTQEALKLALEALLHAYHEDEAHPRTLEAITAIKEALAQTQEPVANIRIWHKNGEQHAELWNWDKGIEALPDGDYDLYTTPPQPEQEPVAYSGNGTAGREADVKPTGFFFQMPKRTWVGLTDDEIAHGWKESWVTEQAWQSAVWWAEDKLKEKNT